MGVPKLKTKVFIIINMFFIIIVSIFPFFTQYKLRFFEEIPGSNALQFSIESSNAHPVNTYAIFYNVYIPNTQNGTLNAFRIVKEQLSQVALYLNNTTPIFFTVIGNYGALDAQTTTILCSSYTNLICILQNVYSAGDEVLTLVQLKAFCDKTNGPARVTYLHNKGSFHDNSYNAQWRRALTAAAMSQDCRFPPARCNLCGVQFFTQFTFFIPGNMWTADCTYIQKLLPIESYSLIRGKMIEKILVMKLRGQILTSLFPNQFCPTERMDFYGIDRFASEHWVASHPDLLPCDMDPFGSLDDIFSNKTSVDKLSWSVAPRHRGSVIANDPERQSFVYNNRSLRLREYYLLPGQLVKWFYLYKKGPPEDSWVWSWFSDGEFWKNSVSHFGEKAVEVVGHHHGFSTESGILFPPKIAGLNYRQNSNSAIFFHISSDSGAKEGKHVEILLNQLHLIHDSHFVSSSPNAMDLYFSVEVQPDADVLEMVVGEACRSLKSLNCVSLGAVEELHSGHTIQEMSLFCANNPHANVIYLNNRLVDVISTTSQKETLLYHMTKAVTSKACDLQHKAQCTSCGLLFYPLWSFFYLGNNFASSCYYVNKLLPLEKFEKKMEMFIGISLAERLRGKLISNLFSDSPMRFGLGQNAIDHWFGSHPSLKPCTVARPSSLEKYFESETDYHTAQAPDTLELTAPYDFSAHQHNKVILDEGLRMREYHFLAGNMLKWIYLYNSVPSEHSWIWKLFPDGLRWKSGYFHYGNEVVDVLTKPYMPDREF